MVNKTVSNNGLDLTVRQTLDYNHALYIILNVVVPKDIKIPEYTQFNNCDIKLDKFKGGSYSLLKSNTYGNFNKILNVNKIKSITIGNEIISLEK